MESSTPTARFLQARITHSTTSLLTRLENILAIAFLPANTPLPTTIQGQPTTSTTNNNTNTAENSSTSLPTSTYSATAIETFNLDVETTALVKAAEDLMGLGRRMKELWLLAGPESEVHSSGAPPSAGETPASGARDGTGASEEDVRAVVEGLQTVLARRAGAG